MKKFAILFIISLFLSSITFAQTTQRLRFTKGRGEAGPLISSKASGNLTNKIYKDFTFTVPKDRSAEITVETVSGAPVFFELISPQKKSLVKDQSEMMDELGSAGTYTIRVYRASDSESGKSAFRLSIWMYV